MHKHVKPRQVPHVKVDVKHANGSRSIRIQGDAQGALWVSIKSLHSRLHPPWHVGWFSFFLPPCFNPLYMLWATGTEVVFIFTHTHMAELKWPRVCDWFNSNRSEINRCTSHFLNINEICRKSINWDTYNHEGTRPRCPPLPPPASTPPCLNPRASTSPLPFYFTFSKPYIDLFGNLLPKYATQQKIAL